MKVGDLVNVFGKMAGIIVKTTRHHDCVQVLLSGKLHWIYIDNVEISYAAR
jgi:hypothetical protein